MSNITEGEDDEGGFHGSYASSDGLVDYALQDTPLHSLLRTELIDVIKVKEILTNTPSSALLIEDVKGRLPLHVSCNMSDTRYGGGCCQNGEVIDTIFQYNKDACKHMDLYGWLPLHHALANYAEGSTIESMLKFYPEAAAEQADKWFALRLALANRADHVSISAVLNAYPAAASVPTSSGSYHLHLSILHQVDGDSICAILDKYPDACKMKSGHGSFPLHLALQHAAPTRAIIKILDGYPDVTSMTDTEGNYPLNLALGKKFPDDVVRRIFNADRSIAARKHVEDGSFALTLALDYEQKKHGEIKVDLVIDILNANPKAAGARDSNDNYPLHATLQHTNECSRSLKLVSLLLDAYPVVVNKQDWNGRTPYELAIYKSSPKDIIDLIASTDVDKIDAWKNAEGLEYVEEIKLATSPSSKSSINVDGLVFEESQNDSNAHQVTIEELKNIIEDLRNEIGRLKNEKAESIVEINRYRTKFGALEGKVMRRRSTMTSPS